MVARMESQIRETGYAFDSGCLDMPHRLVQTSRTSHTILGLPESNAQPHQGISGVLRGEGRAGRALFVSRTAPGGGSRPRSSLIRYAESVAPIRPPTGFEGVHFPPRVLDGFVID